MIEIINTITLKDIVPPVVDTSHTIAIYQSGRIRLSGSLARVLNVSAGDHVAVAMERSTDSSYRAYIARESQGVGFKLRGGDAPYFNRIELVRHMAAHLKLPLDRIRRVRLNVAPAPVYINGFHFHEILLT